MKKIDDALMRQILNESKEAISRALSNNDNEDTMKLLKSICLKHGIKIDNNGEIID